MNPTGDKIELLQVSLLDQNREVVKALRQVADSLGLEFGWHYLLDLTWILCQLGSVKGRRILDAGAGTGILQWFLAEGGATVISADRTSRANLPLRFRTRFQVQGLRKKDLTPYPWVIKSNFSRQISLTNRMSLQAKDLVRGSTWKRSPGKVLVYNQDLRSLPDIPDRSLDAVVAVSALEHNQPEDLKIVIAELMRVLKPGGILAASLNAAPEEDWWHVPSSGWCYSEASLRRLFDLAPEVRSNYDRYPQILQAIRDSAELRDNLAKFYFHSDQNGMPWGKWDPQYVPVGICKVKAF